MKIIFFAEAGPLSWYRVSGPAQVLRARDHKVLELPPKDALTPEELARVSHEARARALGEADVVVVSSVSGHFDDRPEELREIPGALVVELPCPRDPDHIPIFKSWIRAAHLTIAPTQHAANVALAHGARETRVCPSGFSDPCVSERKSFLERSTSDVAAKLRCGRRSTPAAARINLSLERRVAWAGLTATPEDLAPALAATRLIAFDRTVTTASLGPLDLRAHPAWENFKGRYRRAIALKAIAVEDPQGKKIRREDLDRWAVGECDADHVPRAERESGALTIVPFDAYHLALKSLRASVAVVAAAEAPGLLGKEPLALYSWALQGVPVVCSRTGPYAALERDGYPGALFVEHEDVSAWKEALQSLLYDPTRAGEIGDQGREWVTERALFPDAVEPWESGFARAVELSCI